jgi:hypothetical protein
LGVYPEKTGIAKTYSFSAIMAIRLSCKHIVFSDNGLRAPEEKYEFWVDRKDSGQHKHQERNGVME